MARRLHLGLVPRDRGGELGELRGDLDRIRLAAEALSDDGAECAQARDFRLERRELGYRVLFRADRSRREGGDLESLWIDLSEWIDNHFFGDAQRGGWIRALHYYSGRTTESERVWQHWTRLDAEWRLQRPSVYPAFEQWHQDAVGPIKSTDERTALCAQYLEWEAFTSWVGCVVECAHEVPALVASELERRYPGFVAHARSQRVKPCSDPQWLSSELLKWIERHAEAPESLTDEVRAAAHAHLRGERIGDFAAACSLRWSKELPPAFPTFDQWLADADNFVNN